MAERRIAVAGCQHETNTFAPMRAPYSEFVKADAWPGLTRGKDLFGVMAAKNLPMAGFIQAAQNHGQTVLPVLWCAAEPSSYVAEDAFERIADMICDGLSQLNALDAVYLDIHGAMVTEHHQDGEGELLHRVRSVIGSEVPLIASLDLHANVTARMVELADGFTMFRTYPHIDMAAAGSRAYELLARVQRGWAGVQGLQEVAIPGTAVGSVYRFRTQRIDLRFVAGVAGGGCLVGGIRRRFSASGYP